jgi:sugar-specific transcriptional regulator TrmB
MKALFDQMGLKPKERETFLRLLELGAQPVSIIAKHMNIPRPSMYLILESLTKKGLVEEFDRDKVKYAKCIPIKNMPSIIDARKKALDATANLLASKIPELENLENKLSITPKMRFLEGKEGIRRMYEQVLKEEEFWAFFNPEMVKKIMPEYHDKIPQAIRENSGKAREMLVDSPEAREYQKNYSSKNHEIKILPEGTEFHSDVILCRDKMYMIAFGEKQISATEIVSPSLVETQKALFKLIWSKN